MATRANRLARPGPAKASALTLDDLVLLRIAPASASRAELQRDLGPLTAPFLPGSAFRRAAELGITVLVTKGLASEDKGRIAATQAGVHQAQSILGTARAEIPVWTAVIDGLAERALGLSSGTSVFAKASERLEGFAALVLQQHFDLPVAKILSLPDLRGALAIIALEKAFGDRIKTGFGKANPLPAKAARLLAGQLLKPPREFSSDGKLILALASEVLGANDLSIEVMKRALVQRLLKAVHTGSELARPGPTGVRRAVPEPANDLSPGAMPVTAKIKPDIAEFSGAVLDAARPISQGWSGNRKAFISRLWQSIRDTRPGWDLTEVAFKSMLVEAHRAGRLVLASADLKDKADRVEIENSQVVYKNTVWHFVRVED